MAKVQVLAQLWGLMKQNKKYWLIPLVTVLLLIGFLLVAVESTALAPFIYSMF